MQVGALKIDVVERPAVRVACMRYTGEFGEPLGRFWRGSVMPWLADHGLVDCPRYGITLDSRRYDACVELPPGLSLPDAADSLLRGGTYAVTRFKGPRTHLGAAWDALFVECRATHVRDDSRPPFEHYPRGAHFDARTGVFACELCLPVSK
jgi:AraC family transcriptional regulator